jgi:hypothetical protein
MEKITPVKIALNDKLKDANYKEIKELCITCKYFILGNRLNASPSRCKKLRVMGIVLRGVCDKWRGLG